MMLLENSLPTKSEIQSIYNSVLSQHAKIQRVKPNSADEKLFGKHVDLIQEIYSELVNNLDHIPLSPSQRLLVLGLTNRLNQEVEFASAIFTKIGQTLD